MTRYVLGFCFTQDFQNVVLIRKAKPNWQAGLLNGLGGHVEESDSSDGAAMRREFFEESHVDIRDWFKFATMAGPEFSVACFVARSYLDTLRSCHGSIEEPVSVFNVRDTLFYCRDTILPNLPWLMAMAQVYATVGGEPILTIRYP